MFGFGFCLGNWIKAVTKFYSLIIIIYGISDKKIEHNKLAQYQLALLNCTFSIPPALKCFTFIGLICWQAKSGHQLSQTWLQELDYLKKLFERWWDTERFFFLYLAHPCPSKWFWKDFVYLDDQAQSFKMRVFAQDKLCNYILLNF